MGSQSADRLVERLNARAEINGQMYRTHRQIAQREHGQNQHETGKMHARIAQNHHVLQKLDRLVIADLIAFCAESGIPVKYVQKKEAE